MSIHQCPDCEIRGFASPAGPKRPLATRNRGSHLREGIMKRNLLCQMTAAVIGICSAFSFGTAQAQPYPAKPIRLVVPWPAGGITDSATRMLAQALSPRLGHPVVVDNRPGANGQIGADNVAKSAPDGYSLFVASAEPLAINPHVYKSLPYDPVHDFVGIAPFAINPFSLVSRPDFPASPVK